MRERSGAAVGFVGVFVGAGAIGASLTSSLSGGKRNSVNSPVAQPEVQQWERQKNGVLDRCSAFILF
jgi:hypothetical protein